MTAGLAIADDAFAAMVAHAQAASPREACGFLAGPTRSCATAVLPLENVAESPETRFESSAGSTLAAYRTLRDRRWELVAVYHSHPTSPAEPSATDLDRHDLPGTPAVIVSLAGGAVDVRGWDLDARPPRAIAVTRVPPAPPTAGSAGAASPTSAAGG
jgi:proteasome lid subunit RPN8/RPN11